MEQTEFNAQMTRLRSCFGEKAYPDERVRAIFDSVKTLPGKWLEKLTTDFVVNNKYAPLPIEFITAANQEKLRNPLNLVAAKDIVRMPDSIFTHDERKEMFQFIQDRLDGKVSSEDARQYAEMIQGILNERAQRVCKNCENTGFVWKTKDNCQYVYKCSCHIGKARQENFATY